MLKGDDASAESRRADLAWGGPTNSGAYLITFFLALIILFAALTIMITENIDGSAVWLTNVSTELQSNAGLLGLMVVAGLVLAMAQGGRRRF